LVSDQLLGLILSAAIGIVGILATLTGVALTNRSAQKLLTIQLQHEETKNAIVALNNRMISLTSTETMFSVNLRGFLRSIESAYLPDSVREWATEKLDEYNLKRDEYGSKSELQDQFDRYRADFAKKATEYLISSLGGTHQQGPSGRFVKPSLGFD
jgi:hypothetical protein